MNIRKYIIIQKIIVCLILLNVISLSGCARYKGYSEDEKKQVQAYVIRILEARTFITYQVESDKYDNNRNIYTLYVFAPSENKKEKIDITNIEFKDGKVDFDNWQFYLWNGKEYIKEESP